MQKNNQLQYFFLYLFATSNPEITISGVTQVSVDWDGGGTGYIEFTLYALDNGQWIVLHWGMDFNSYYMISWKSSWFQYDTFKCKVEATANDGGYSVALGYLYL